MNSISLSFSQSVLQYLLLVLALAVVIAFAESDLEEAEGKVRLYVPVVPVKEYYVQPARYYVRTVYRYAQPAHYGGNNYAQFIYFYVVNNNRNYLLSSIINYIPSTLQETIITEPWTAVNHSCC